MAGVPKILHALRLVFLRLIKRKIKTSRLFPKDFHDIEVKKILFLCLHARLSDLLLCTPTFKAVRETYLEALVCLAVRPNFAGLLDGIKEIDEFVNCATWRQWSLGYLTRLARQLRQGFDLVIVLDQQNCIECGMLARATGARFILGSEQAILEGFDENFFFTLHAPASVHDRHWAERHLDIVRYIGVEFEDLTEQLVTSSDEKMDAVRFLHENGIEVGDVTLAIHLAPTDGESPWDAHKFVSVVDHFGRKLGLQIVLFREESDAGITQEFLEGLPFRPLEADNCGLERRVALLSLCNLLITADLEMLHLAAAVGTPTVALWGRNDPDLLKPAGERFVHLRGSDSACANIGVADVRAAAEKLLKKYPKQVSGLPANFDISDQAVNDALGFGDIAEDDSEIRRRSK